jgi:UrcA family protein
MELRTYTRSLAVGLLAVGGLATATMPAHATVVASGGRPEALAQRVISLRGLDLRRPADVAALYARIRKAAEVVCGDGPPPGSRLLSGEQHQCIENSVDSAVLSVDRRPLSDMHRQARAGAGEHTKAGA